MRICLIAAVALLGLQPAFAGDTKPTEESIRHLFATMGTSHLIDDMMTKLMPMMKEQINWSAMEPLMIRVYRDTFTQQEVDAMASFYSSPAGRSVAGKLPVAMQESMQLMQERMRSLIPRIGQLEKDTAQRLKEAADPRAAAAPGQQSAPSPH